MNNIKTVFCILTAVAFAAFALPASATGIPKPYRVVISVPPGQTTAPFTVQAKITNESILPIQSLNLFVSGVTIVGVSNAADTFQLFPHLSLPLPGFAKLAFTGSSISITKDPMLWGETLTLTIAVNTCGDAQWAPVAWLGLLLNGQTFNLDAKSILTSSIDCGGQPLAAGAGFTVPDSLAADCVISGFRGDYDKDGTTPTDVSYFVTNTIPANGQVHFRWPVDNTGDPAAAFEYTITCPGAAPPQTDIAWFNTDGTPSTGTTGTPDFIHTFFGNDYVGDPLGCEPPPPGFTEALLPVPYAAIDADSPVLMGDTYITISSTSPADAIAHPATPFDIVIGSGPGLPAERMTVTDVTCLSNDGDTGHDDTECSEHEGPPIWFVTRGVGGTAAQSHAANALVMYTPLPIMTVTQGVATKIVNGVPVPNPEYLEGNQAQMCVVSRSCPVLSPPNTHCTTFIDIGDGWGSHP